MTSLSNIKSIYFLGIGGIGMSALAEYLCNSGKKVSGYDRTKSDVTESLERIGISIHYNANIELIPTDIDLVVYTPAISSDFEEFIYIKKLNIPIIKRAELLGAITQGKHNICIAGTHGKTTITALAAHILSTSNKKCTAFIGGIAKNYNSNLIIDNTSNYMIAEADEFDRSFLQLHPDIAVISSTDSDHLDIYGDKNSLQKSFQDFANLLNKSSKDAILIKKNGLTTNWKNELTYSLDDVSADYHLNNLKIKNNTYIFDIKTPSGIIKDIEMKYPGLHNIENAIAAIAVALHLHVDEATIAEAIGSFEGVKRRFDIQINNEKIMYIDDYAHHPEEIKRTITSLKHFTNDKPVLGIFQPHLYSRTRDFVDEFASSLSLLDSLILLDIYPAREKPIEGITSEFLLSKCTNKHKILCTKENIFEEIKKQNPEILLTMGAGDIDSLVEPIKKMLS